MTPNLLDELEEVMQMLRIYDDDKSVIGVRRAALNEICVNFLRTHAPTLADMAKRMERGAPALTDAQCDAIYSALNKYGREVDPCEFGLPLYCDESPEKRREIIRTAIDATQEGAG